MTESCRWILAPQMAASLSRQAHQTRDTESIMAPLREGADTSRRIASLRDAMFRGQLVNDSEHRAAGHWALRLAASPRSRPSDAWPDSSFAPGGGDLMPRMRDVHRQSQQMADQIREGVMRSSSGERFTHIVHLGIGGSDLGPQLLIDSLKFCREKAPVASVFISNLDVHAIEHALAELNPHATLVIIASKSFTTQETMHNAGQLLQWMESAGVALPRHNFIAVTSHTERAQQWGVPEHQVLWLDESIGGRFSIWGPVSLTARVVLGNAAVDAFIEGGLQMDEHFLSSPLDANLPAVLAAVDFYNLRQRGLPTLMVSAYDSRLGLLVPYLKQLWMESLGKRIDRSGRKLAGPACPILWGDVGTNAQHAFFQLLHQGEQGVAIELIGVRSPEHEAIESHHALLANLIAQAQALYSGQDDSNAVKACRGGHPVSLLMLERLDAASLGALIALWEHRVICMAALSDINPFDQWGVELGKSIATAAFAALQTPHNPDSQQKSDVRLDDISRSMIAWLRGHR